MIMAKLFPLVLTLSVLNSYNVYPAYPNSYFKCSHSVPNSCCCNSLLSRDVVILLKHHSGTERVTLERCILILIINFVLLTLTAPAAEKIHDPSRDLDSAREQLEHEKQKLKEVQHKQSYWTVFPKMLTSYPLHVKSYFNFFF